MFSLSRKRFQRTYDRWRHIKYTRSFRNNHTKSKCENIILWYLYIERYTEKPARLPYDKLYFCHFHMMNIHILLWGGGTHNRKSKFCRLLLLAQRFFIVHSILVVLSPSPSLERPLSSCRQSIYFSFLFIAQISSPALCFRNANIPKERKKTIWRYSPLDGPRKLTMWWKILRCVRSCSYETFLLEITLALEFAISILNHPLQFQSQCKSISLSREKSIRCSLSRTGASIDVFDFSISYRLQYFCEQSVDLVHLAEGKKTRN